MVEAQQYVLTAALQSGLALPHSCRAGNCGSCRALLISGEVVHDDFDSSALTDTQQSHGQVLLCRCKAVTDLEIDIEEFTESLSPARFWPARISRLKPLCHDVMNLSIKLAPGRAFEFIAGQYVNFMLSDTEQRSYSIAGASDGQLDFHVRKVEKGTFSERVFNRYRMGDIVRLYGPLGTFFIRQGNMQPIIMLAGGTGFAPIKAMLEQISRQENKLPVALYWGVRTLDDLYLKFWLEQFAQQNQWFSFVVVLSEADELYGGRQGFIHQAVLDDYADLSQHQIYASGPPAMIKAAQKDFADAGMNPDRFYFDSFDYSPQTLAKINQQTSLG